MGHDVTRFSPFPFHVGQKIHIEGTKRAGDWEVVGVDEDHVTLRCPISDKRFTWPHFCYVTEEETDVQWPQGD